MVVRLDPGLARRLVLLPDVDVGGRVVADQHRGQARPAQLGDLGSDVLPDPRGQSGPVHPRRRHARKRTLRRSGK